MKMQLSNWSLYQETDGLSAPPVDSSYRTSPDNALQTVFSMQSYKTDRKLQKEPMTIA